MSWHTGGRAVVCRTHQCDEGDKHVDAFDPVLYAVSNAEY